MSIAHDDLGALFGFLDHDELSLLDVVERYVNYHGGLNHGHQVLLIGQLRKAAAVLDAPAAAKYGDRDVVWDDGRIAPGFLDRFAPGFVTAFYHAAPAVDFTRATILPASPNQWRSTDLPAPFNMRLRQETRPAVEVLFGEGHLLFVSPYGYQRFDPVEGCAWAAAASRAFPRSIEGHHRVDVDEPIAVIQDQFDGANFAHFLYDCVPRVLHLVERFPEFARSCRFLMGGEPGPFHALILRWVCERHGLAAGQFVFPRNRAIWRPKRQTAFFSDQVESVTHPLNMCHAETLRMVRELLDPRALPLDSPERIYISRADAPGRQVLNEPDLAAALADRGYVTLRLSELDAPAQIGALARARHVVAPHGMGLTNLLFNQPLGSLVEIFNPRIGSDAFAFVARALGMEYRFSVGQDRPETFFGTIVDVGDVMSLVARVDAGPPAGGRRSILAVQQAANDGLALRLPPSPPPEVPEDMLSDTDLVQKFESLGDNSEFGVVQRHVGAEPLGFFRFNVVHLASLTDMLDTDFRDADRPEDIELRRATEAADSELHVHHRRYQYTYNTFHHDLDADKVRVEQLRKISFLKEKLIADLRSGNKIFVRKGEHLVHEAADLLRRLRRFGTATLLWVVPEDEVNPAGTVRVLQPGLLQGFLDRFAPEADTHDLSSIWLTMLRNAYALRAGDCVPGTVIAPPRERGATNLFRREHLFPRTANCWIGASSVAMEAGAGAPAPIHPDSLVIEHRLTVETVQATGAICGIALQHGLAPGAPYVASMDVWIPGGAPLEEVGAVFAGLPATQVRIADLTRRDMWQRVWVAARATHEGHVNPGLFAVGKEGARLYSTAWQMEIGHAPSRYVSNLAGILPNRGSRLDGLRQQTAG